MLMWDGYILNQSCDADIGLENFDRSDILLGLQPLRVTFSTKRHLISFKELSQMWGAKNIYDLKQTISQKDEPF